jgi:ubiquinone/menaquinone biosynthesis C-methylase UbiE
MRRRGHSTYDATGVTDFITIAEAFSRTAERYDRFAEDHPHQTRMRHKVYAHLTRHLAPGARILELNAGTGTDAVHLAQRGFRVHATDIAPGMLKRLREKVDREGLRERISVQECSFTELDRITGGPYDAVFSDLGGLNCIADLAPVVRSLPRVLRPGGVVTWVLMPRVCLWELALIFTGRIRLALRRLAPRGTRAHLEGLYFTVYYFSPPEVRRAFGADYRLLEIEGLSVITPTAESKNLAKRHPRVYRALAWLDDRLSHVPPWRGWGDFFIISLRYAP